MKLPIKKFRVEINDRGVLHSKYANKFSRKGIPSTRFTKYLALRWPLGL